MNMNLIRSISMHKMLSNRIPLIKFKAALKSQGAPKPQGASAPQAGAVGKNNTVQAGPVIDDYQLPARFRRTLISEAECDAINYGGAQ